MSGYKPLTRFAIPRGVTFSQHAEGAFVLYADVWKALGELEEKARSLEAANEFLRTGGGAVQVMMPLQLSAEMLKAVRAHPTTATDDLEEMHRRIGWLLSAWDVLVEARMPGVKP